MEKKLTVSKFDDLLKEGKISEAIDQARKIARDRSTLDTLLALVDIREKKIEEARIKLQSAISKKPRNYFAKGYLGICEVAKKQWKKAELLLDEALQEYPDNETFLLNRAIVHSEKQEFDLSLEITNRLMRLAENINVYSLHVGALRAKYKFDEALSVLNKAIKIFPERVELKKIRADLYSEIDPLLAVKEYDEIEKIQDLGLSGKWNSSFSYLRAGNFEKGFDYYEHGLSDTVGRVGRPLPPISRKLKRISPGDADKDKYTLVLTEQGIGDQVLFASCLKDLIAQNPKLILISDQRMIPVFRRSFPQVSVHNFGLIDLIHRWSGINGFIPIGSLFYYYRKDYLSFERRKETYLLPDQALVESFRKKFVEKKAKKIIGISWKGGFWERQQKGKSLDFSNWATIFRANPDCYFVSLQYGDVTKEKDYLKEMNLKNVSFIDGFDFKKNINAWHSLICACDEILSISTAMVHFAAASGKKVNLLLNTKQQPFIWGLNHETSFVYENVHIYKMKETESLEDYFFRLTKDLIL